MEWSSLVLPASLVEILTILVGSSFNDGSNYSDECFCWNISIYTLDFEDYNDFILAFFSERVIICLKSETGSILKLLVLLMFTWLDYLCLLNYWTLLNCCGCYCQSSIYYYFIGIFLLKILDESETLRVGFSSLIYYLKFDILFLSCSILPI